MAFKTDPLTASVRQDQIEAYRGIVFRLVFLRDQFEEFKVVSALRSSWPFLVIISLACVAGCAKTVDPEIAAHRSQFLLSQEPDGAVAIMKLRETLEADATSGESAAVIVARIGTDEDQTWETGKAEFIVSDVSHDHGDGHDAENCPFCQLEPGAAAKKIALVRFEDDQGEVISVDARKLFQLQPGQEVVVSGKATIDNLGMLVVAADGIFAR